jgi:hypothetical protein
MICFEKISLLLCPGGDFLPDPHDFVASLLLLIRLFQHLQSCHKDGERSRPVRRYRPKAIWYPLIQSLFQSGAGNGKAYRSPYLVVHCFKRNPTRSARQAQTDTQRTRNQTFAQRMNICSGGGISHHRAPGKLACARHLATPDAWAALRCCFSFLRFRRRMHRMKKQKRSPSFELIDQKERFERIDQRGPLPQVRGIGLLP